MAIVKTKASENDLPDHLDEFLNEFVEELRKQLWLDFVRCGDAWRHCPKEGQEMRIFDDYTDYFDQFVHAGTPIPWLEVAGSAYIAWVREKHPEVLIPTSE